MTELFRQILMHESRITRFFQKEQLSRETVEDLTQEVLCRCYESNSRFRGTSAPGTWIYAICRNVLYEYFRKKKTIGNINEFQLSVGDKTEQLMSEIDLERARENLPSHLKVIYEKKYILHLKIREIAQDLSLPEGTIKYYLFVLRREFKRLR